MSTPEGRVKAKVIKALEAVGAYYNANAVGPFGSKGHPDIVALYQGHAIWIEVKATKNKCPRESQLQKLNHIYRQGGIALVIHDGNEADVINLLDALTLGMQEEVNEIVARHTSRIVEMFDSIEQVCI